MTGPRPSAGASALASTADLAQRLASAAAQAVRKTHTLTGAIPARARSERFNVTFADGTRASYRVSLERLEVTR